MSSTSQPTPYRQLEHIRLVREGRLPFLWLNSEAGLVELMRQERRKTYQQLERESE